MVKNALVTGGAGFVGSVVSRHLLRDGFSVTIIDDLSNGKRSNVPPGAQFIEADLATEAAYQPLERVGYDVIYHVAAQASNAVSLRDPLRDLASNQLATLRLLEYARETGSRRFVFTSSMSTYGDASAFPTTEMEPLRPRTPYAAHKAASEDYLRVYGDEYGLIPTVFRLYTTYGGEQNLDNLDQGLLSIYLAYLLRGEPIIVKGPLERERDIVHISDVAGAMVAVLDEPGTFGRTYNLCSGLCLTIDTLVRTLILEAGENPDTYPIVVESGTPGDPFKTHGSYEAAMTDFGYVPKVMPLDGIQQTVRALLEGV
jgi:UDP-glucose 4-epimerase